MNQFLDNIIQSAITGPISDGTTFDQTDQTNCDRKGPDAVIEGSEC